MMLAVILMALTIGVVSYLENGGSNQVCGGNIHLYDRDFQLVSSPKNTSGLYPNGVDCLWNISVSHGYRIMVASNFSLLEPSNGCLYDYLEILDKTNYQMISVGRFCWDNPVQYISTSENIYIRFHSDDFVNGFGFTLRLSKVTSDNADVCNTTITRPRNLRSVNYPKSYPPNTVCFYRIQAPKRKRIKLLFADFKLEKTPCASDSLKVYDGASSGSTLIGSYCWRNNPKFIISSSRDMFLVFTSNDFVEDKGFNILIEFVTENQDKKYQLIDKPVPEKYDADCSEVISTLGHNLTSPTSGINTYEKRKHCYTVLLAPDRHRVMLHFLRFDIEKSNECQFDYLRIQENGDSKNSIKICGYHGHSFFIMSKGRQLQLEFKTDRSVEGTGYFATYTFVNTCSVNGTAKDVKSDRLHSCADQPCGLTGTCYNDGSGSRFACPTGLTPPDCLNVLNFTERSKNSSVEISTSITLKCRVNHPHSVTVWYHDSKVITPSSYFKIDDHSNLNIVNIQSVHQGKYTCDVLASQTVLSHSIWLSVKQVTPVPFDQMCGMANLSYQVMSHDATNATIPWQAFLWSKRNNTFCGGTIISERWILTAAHCITQYGVKDKKIKFNIDDIKVYAGTDDCKAKKTNIKMMTIKSFKIHPRYTQKTYDNDIALIQLQDSFKFTDSLRRVCLPTPGKAESLVKSGVIGYTSGCGYNSLGKQAEVLRYLKVPLQDEDTCLKTVSKGKLSPGSAICGGNAKKGLGDPTKGDSGGPLVIQENWKWYLVGLVSFGDGRNGHNKYGFYTNVSNYYDWIKTFTDGCGRNDEQDKLDLLNSLRIIGGKKADVGLLPWVVGIRKDRTRGYYCVGVILGEYWVLTAAHCVIHEKRIEVVTGDVDHFRDHPQKAKFPIQIHKSKKTYLHDHYNPHRRGIHDLALLHLTARRNYYKWNYKRGIEFNKFSQPVCLPPSKPQKPGSECIIAGWGTNTSTLMWAKVKVTDINECRRLYSTEFQNEGQFMCAGKNNTDICSGDSGGGLFCKSDRYHVTGVATMGKSPCGVYPGGFTRVAPYIAWIQTTIKKYSYSFEDIFREHV